MSLALPDRFVQLMSEAGLVQSVHPIPATCKIRPEWTPEQYGDGTEKSQQYRVRRWLAAWQATAIAYELPVWSRYVPCHICSGPVDAWQSDGDHIVSRENGGRSDAGNLALTHPACNRILKNSKNAPANVQNAFRATRDKVVTYRATPNPKGNVAQREFHSFWNLFDRRED